ncbi:MAG: hypothetical protein KAT41_01035 [Candidatus Marinimicrobia bacterium]|nr:hypothetical protein [Candidatus Neomarinimicrobiota bacterium]
MRKPIDGIYGESDFTFDKVVIASKGDVLLLGAHTIKGLNMAEESANKSDVAAGLLFKINNQIITLTNPICT